MSRFFSKRITWTHLAAIVLLIGIACLCLTLSLKKESNGLKEEIATARLEKSALQREEASLQQEISISGTDAYIEAVARDSQGYLMPGEIQFVITNPDELYGVGTNIQIEQAGN